MSDLIIGAVAAAGFLLLVNKTRRQGLRLAWWKWALTVLAFIYAVFVLEVITAFLEEGAGQAALVTGIFLGVIAVVWGVLLGRFAFARSRRSG
jgi:hypothetical protein